MHLQVSLKRNELIISNFNGGNTVALATYFEIFTFLVVGQIVLPEYHFDLDLVLETRLRGQQVDPVVSQPVLH